MPFGGAMQQPAGPAAPVGGATEFGRVPSKGAPTVAPQAAPDPATAAAMDLAARAAAKEAEFHMAHDAYAKARPGPARDALGARLPVLSGQAAAAKEAATAAGAAEAEKRRATLAAETAEATRAAVARAGLLEESGKDDAAHDREPASQDEAYLKGWHAQNATKAEKDAIRAKEEAELGSARARYKSVTGNEPDPSLSTADLRSMASAHTVTARREKFGKDPEYVRAVAPLDREVRSLQKALDRADAHALRMESDPFAGDAEKAAAKAEVERRQAAVDAAEGKRDAYDDDYEARRTAKATGTVVPEGPRATEEVGRYAQKRAGEAAAGKVVKPEDVTMGDIILHQRSIADPEQMAAWKSLTPKEQAEVVAEEMRLAQSGR